MKLTELKKGVKARVTGFSGQDEELIIRLREIGFAEGDCIELRHNGLFGRDPMSVALNGAHIALRRNEAGAVLIEPAGQ